MLAIRDTKTGRYFSSQTLEKRFWEKVDKKGDDECWEWVASGNYGYGQLWCGNTFLRAHRFSWMLYNNMEIPNGMFVCHLCDNRGCVNPKHLFLGTPSDNMKDMRKKGRQSNQKGQSNGYAKLTDDDVKVIREMGKDRKYPQKVIMEKFGICRLTVYRILSRRNWSHI